MDKQPNPIPIPIPTHTGHSPYPYYPRRSFFSSSGGGGGKLASCVAAAAFLILLLIVAVLAFFFLFRPRDPHVRIRGVQLPGFALRSGNSTATTSASFTLAQSASVRNPNRASFSHYDSTITLLYRGSPLSFVYIPAGEIAGGRTQYMEASLAIPQFPLDRDDDGTEMEVETWMKVKGRVKVLKFFMHRVSVTAHCRVAVAAGNGAVLRVRC